MKQRISRRTFGRLLISSTLALSAAEFPSEATRRALAGTTGGVLKMQGVQTHEISCVVNRVERKTKIDTRTTLLDYLRETLGLTGSKKGCDLGQCGACTVLVNGRRIKSCLALAVMHSGDQITTIEGLAEGDTLHPMQESFIEHDGFQCGFCTPGQIMSAVALLKEPCGASDAEVRECMSGNLCRCGAYPNIVAAIQAVRNGSGNATL
jgi:xanthine dehydrogenase YagT iron-sulfur-binding subunit